MIGFWTKGSTKRRVPPRRRVVPWWRSRSMLTAGALALLASLVGGAWWSWQARWPQCTLAATQARIVAATAGVGFTVDEVFVIGRRQTSRATVLETLGVQRGSPILALDLEEARKRLLALPWVRSASVQRLLPNTVIVRLIERRPLALWQNRGQYAVIDEQGQITERDDFQSFRGLPLVVGEDAPAHAAELLETLKSEPDLMSQVKAAVRVGGRRWDLRLAGDINVRLPEQDPLLAWKRLAEYQRTYGVLRDDVAVLDMRLPDRLIVQRPSAAPKGRKGSAGHDT